MNRPDWSDGLYMDWADQERLIRQDLAEINEKIKRRTSMEEITLQVKQNPGVINVNFDDLEKALDAKLAEYKGAVFTAETKDIAKKELASLRKQKTELDDSRKSIKKEWMKPYDDFEKRAKQLLAKFDEPIQLIDGQVKAFDEKRKEERRKDIQAAYESLIGDMAEYLPLSKIYDTKWENVSTSMKSIKEVLSDLVESTAAAVRVISTMESDATDKALKLYKDTLDMSKAITYINDYERQKAEIMRKEEERRKVEEERKRHAEIERAKAAERAAIEREERIRREEREKAEAAAREKLAAETKAAEPVQIDIPQTPFIEPEEDSLPFEQPTTVTALYRVVATPEELEQVEMAFNSIGIYFERRDA